VSVNCPVTVQFEVSKPEMLPEIARRHSGIMARRDVREEDFDRDALRLLEHVAEGRGVALGPKGDMFTWGSVGNYTSVAHFVDALRPFFADLYRRGAIWNFVGIVVMSQTEQRAFSTIAEVSCDQTVPRTRESAGRVTLVVRVMETAFPLFEGFYERAEGMLPSGVVTSTWEDTP